MRLPELKATFMNYWWPETKASEENKTLGSNGTDSTKSTLESMDKNPDTAEGSKSAFLRNRFDILKNCLVKPEETILKYPIQSLIYNVGIKGLFYLVALSFPIVGWSAIAFSAALFERVAFLNPVKYMKAVFGSFKDAWRYVLNKLKRKPANNEVTGEEGSKSTETSQKDVPSEKPSESDGSPAGKTN